MLDIDEEVKAFITDYKLNLYDCHEHDTFNQYCAGLRKLFEAVRYGSGKEQLKRIMEENKDAYNYIDGNTRELLETVAGKRQEHFVMLICKKLQKNKPAEIITEEVEEELPEVEKSQRHRKKWGAMTQARSVKFWQDKRHIVYLTVQTPKYLTIYEIQSTLLLGEMLLCRFWGRNKYKTNDALKV